MAPRERDVAIVDLFIAKVRDDTPNFGREARRVITLSIGQVSEEGVTTLELKAGGQTLCYSRRQCVIITAAAADPRLYVPPVRIPEERAACTKADCIRRKLIQISLPSELTRMTTGVREAQSGLKSQIPFDGQVPLIDFRILIMDVLSHSEVFCPRLRQFRGKRIRKLKRRLSVNKRLIVKGLVRAVDCEGDTQQRAERSFDVPAEPAANHCFSVRRWPPCKSEARSKVVLFRETQAFRNASLLCRENRRVANGCDEIRVQ